MLDRLEELGAPRGKTVPSSRVRQPGDVSLLRSQLYATALPFVGRCAETKSPHLTLLAFHQVLKAVPDATLTMSVKGEEVSCRSVLNFSQGSRY